jgi:hypothetical protein
MKRARTCRSKRVSFDPVTQNLDHGVSHLVGDAAPLHCDVVVDILYLKVKVEILKKIYGSRDVFSCKFIFQDVDIGAGH